MIKGVLFGEEGTLLGFAARDLADGPLRRALQAGSK